MCDQPFTIEISWTTVVSIAWMIVIIFYWKERDDSIFSDCDYDAHPRKNDNRPSNLIAQVQLQVEPT